MIDLKEFFDWTIAFLSDYGVDGLTVLAIIGITEFVKTVTKKTSKLYALLPLVLGIGSGMATTKVWTFSDLWMNSIKYAGTAMILYQIWVLVFEPAKNWAVEKFFAPKAKPKTSN